MAVENPTAANVSLWTHFFKHELGIDGRQTRSSDYLSRAAAAAMSTWLTVAMAPRIGRMYRQNAPQVTGFGFTATTQAPAEEPPVPAELRKADRAARREPNAPERRRRYERRSTSTAGTTSAAASRSEMATTSH